MMEQLRRTKMHFVHCFLPQHGAGLCDVKINGNSGERSNGSSPKTSVSSQEGDILMNVPLVRSQVKKRHLCQFKSKQREASNIFLQLRGAQILDAVRLHKNGFPESIGYSEFWRKFHLLAAANGERDGATKVTSKPPTPPALGEVRGAVEKLLVALEIDRSAVRMGNTQVRTK